MILHNCHRGFSLIEILVAFSIAAVALAIMFQIYSRGTRAAILGQEYTEAIAIAESRLDESGTLLSLNQPEYEGTELNKYTWKVRIDDYDADNSIDSISLKTIQVAVYWKSAGGNHQISLQSLKPYIALQ